MKSMTVMAQVEELERVLAFLREELEPYECSAKTMFQLELVVEELFVNIASYAYADTGEVEIGCEVSGETPGITIRFADRGRPFDPLARADAETTPEALENRVGGLGILLVKKTMDEVAYAYEDGANVLTVKKYLP
ncbi:MAG: ATP-binding protein [Oscillospiraceae bacterium]|nr:ATP-binding protein [Oscillospiraceae bacterium]